MKYGMPPEDMWLLISMHDIKPYIKSFFYYQKNNETIC